MGHTMTVTHRPATTDIHIADADLWRATHDDESITISQGSGPVGTMPYTDENWQLASGVVASNNKLLALRHANRLRREGVIPAWAKVNIFS